MADKPKSILFFAKDPHNVAVYERVLRTLIADGRYRVSLTSRNAHTRPSNGIYDSFDLPRELRVDHRVAALRRYDLYLSPDVYILAKRSRIKVHTFHGISIKGKAFSEKVLPFDRLFLIGPYQKRRFVERGILKEDDARFVEVGMPKTDAFFDGSLDRKGYLGGLGLDPARRTILYAPTWRPESSLNKMGEALLRSMNGGPYNLMVKLHDLSYEVKDGVDWAKKLEGLRAPNVAVVTDRDVTPALFAADLLISDASSVANEYTLLDRPIVFIDVPELFAKYRDSIDLEGWGQSSGPVARTVEEVHAHIESSLADPSRYAGQRGRIAREGFYNPGRATQAAVEAIEKLVGLQGRRADARRGSG